MNVFTKLNKNPQTTKDYVELFKLAASDRWNGTRAMNIVFNKINEMLLSVPKITDRRRLEDMLETICLIYDAACKSGLSFIQFDEIVFRLNVVKAEITMQIRYKEMI